MTKKLLSIFVAVLMVLAVVPVNVFAFSAGSAKDLVPLKTKSVNEPTRDSVVYSTDFETDPASDGWTFTDADGDGNNWTWSTDWIAHSGSGIIYSQSYSSSALTPDNWAWSPSFTVPSSGYTYVQFYYAGELPAYSAEVFAVYAKVNGSDVKLTDDITAVGGYKDVIADITAYAGQTIQIAIRHYNCTDQYMLNVDTFGIFNLNSEYDDGITNVYTNSFETSSDLANITGYDVDGDGNWWGLGSASNNFAIFDGSNALVSQSAQYNSSSQSFTAIEGVDNIILFKDAFEVPANGGAVSIWAASADFNHQEHFSFLVGTVDAWDNENSEDSIYIVNDEDSEFIATFLYEQFWVDLSDFAGQSVYIAVEHHNNPGDVNYFLQIDYLEYWTYDEVIAPETHTVTFVDGLTNEVISTVEVEDGADATAPAAPEHEGYTFAGWEGSYTNVTDDVTVTATYTVNSYNLTILYLDENGNRMTASAVYSIPYGTAYSYPSPEFPHYTADTPVVEGTMGAENATVIVTYVIDKYTVTFVDWNGMVLSEQTVPYNGSATAPADPEREGYTFTGWDVDFTNVTSNLTVTAQYEQNAPSQYLKGDVNCDGLVDSADITLAAAYAMSAGSVTAQGVANGDMNGDGLLTAADLSALYGYIQG